MAHPADPSPKGPVAFTHARLSPEEADRLASMFRPSWELDDAPFTGAGTLSAADMQALQGGGVRADLRAAAAGSPFGTNGNGAHAAPAPQAQEPASSVVIDQGPRPAPLAAKGTMMGIGVQLPAAPPTAPLPEAPLSRPPSRPSQRPLAPSFQIGPPTPRAQPVVAAPSASDVQPYPKKSQMGLWIGLGAAAVILLGVGIWAVASSGGEKPAAPAATATATAKPTEDKLSSVPPPPPATATAAAATTTAAAVPVPPPPPATTTVAAAPPAVPTAPVTALPVAPPPPTHVTVGAAAPPRPASFGAPAAPPQKTPRKGGPTIVRDVPF